METTDPNPNANPESEEDPFYVVKTEAIRTRGPGPNLTADWKDYRKGTRGRRESPEKGRRIAQERRSHLGRPYASQEPL